MKKIFLLLSLSLMVIQCFAQKGKVVTAQNLKDEGKLDKALAIIESTIDPNNEKSSKSIGWPKTWETRGEIFQAIYQANGENDRSLSDAPLTEAFNSYKKALELDVNNKISNNLKIKLTLLANLFQDQGVNSFNSEDFKNALYSFEKILEINKLPIFTTDNSNNIDTAIIYNTGMAALKTGDHDKAVAYLKDAAKYGYNGATTWIMLSQVYKEKNDTISAIESLKQGFEKYPGDDDILSNMIQIYIDSNQNKEALHYLDLAITRDPEKAVFYLAKGNLFDRNLDFENAKIWYEKAIEEDSEMFLAYFNLGVIYYNDGVKLLENAKDIPANENALYEKTLKEADTFWKKSLPYLEKCYSLDSKDIATIESLKNLYYRLNMMNKYEALQNNTQK